MSLDRSSVRDLDQAVQSFFTLYYSNHPANPTGVLLYTVKNAVPGLRGSRFKDVKRYFREHPDYWLAGQRVLPTQLAATLGDAVRCAPFCNRTLRS